MTLVAEQTAIVEALRDEGYTDVEIEAELGIALERPLPKAPPARPKKPLRPAWGSKDGPEKVLSFVMLGKVAEEREEMVERTMAGAGRASWVISEGGGPLSRGGLASRVAEAMARRRLGLEWHQLDQTRRATFVGLAVLAVESLEDVAA